MKFSIFFSFHSLLLSVITVSMDPIPENDNIYVPFLHLSSETPKLRGARCAFRLSSRLV